MLWSLEHSAVPLLGQLILSYALSVWPYAVVLIYDSKLLIVKRS